MDLTTRLLTGGLAGAATIALDQVSKQWLYDYLVVGARGMVELAPFANLVAVWNYGVSFGMFNSGATEGAWIFVALALVIVAALLRWLWITPRRLIALALGLVIGGAVGNVIDRLRFGAVFDFLDLHALGWHWPAFNVADSAISVGVVILFLDALFDRSQSSK